MSNFVLHHDPVLYYAFGLIRGIYHPSEKNFLYGHFLTDDGISIPAQIPQKLAAQLRENPELLSMPLIWRCYPSFDPPSVKLYKICLTQPPLPVSNPKDVKEVNQFHILGKVTQIEGLTVTLLLKRNRRPSKTQGNEFSFTLIGELPIDAVGQYWQFIVQRQEWNWNIIEAQPVQTVPAKVRPVEKPLPKKTRQSPHQQNQPTPLVPQVGDEINFKTRERVDNVVSLVSSSNNPPSSTETPTTPTGKKLTTGKLEVTIKINQFPATVKTGASGVKEFEVDTGSRKVTIALKPKLFTKLEKAQAEYPSWVAALTGKIGKLTESSFVLLEPNLQVFQLQPKEPTPTSPSVAPETPSVTPQNSPNSKDNQPPSNQPTAIKSNNVTQKKDLNTTPSTVNKRTASPKTGANFQVKVNGQIIPGREKLTFFNRVVQVDGVTVAQAKMVIIEGSPKVLQTDATVKNTPDSTSTVLIGR
jgi:hypothetical protein